MISSRWIVVNVGSGLLTELHSVPCSILADLLVVCWIALECVGVVCWSFTVALPGQLGLVGSSHRPPSHPGAELGGLGQARAARLSTGALERGQLTLQLTW